MRSEYGWIVRRHHTPKRKKARHIAWLKNSLSFITLAILGNAGFSAVNLAASGQYGDAVMTVVGGLVLSLAFIISYGLVIRVLRVVSIWMAG